MSAKAILNNYEDTCQSCRGSGESHFLNSLDRIEDGRCDSCHGLGYYTDSRYYERSKKPIPTKDDVIGKAVEAIQERLKK